MNNMKLLKVLAIGVTIGGVALAMNTEKASATEEAITPISSNVWVARSVDQIKVDLDKMTDTTYTIVAGDTLFILGEATGIPFVEIAAQNGIVDPDWIYEGDKLIFDQDGNGVTIQSPDGETRAQISQDPETGAGSVSIGGGSNASNGDNVSENVATPPAENGNNNSNNGGGVADVDTPTTPEEDQRVITQEKVGENEYFTRFRVGPFLDRDEVTNWVRENYPDGLKGYEVDDSGDYIYIYIEVGHGNGGGNGSGGDNGSGGGDVTTPPTDGGGTEGGDNSNGGEETDVDNIPVNIGNTGIFAATQEEADALAWEMIAAGKFPEGHYNWVVGPAFNAKGDIIGWTVHSRP